MPYVSHNLSPMATLAKYIKGTDPTAKVVFKEVQTSTLTNENSYSVCFLTVDAKPVEVLPSEAEYNSLEVGQVGELTYQGMRFIRFAKEQ